MLRRVVPVKVTLAKDAPAGLNASRSYVPTGRNVKYPPAESVWSHTWPAAFARATVASGFRTAGFASLTVPLSRTPCPNIASNEVVLPRATTTRPNVAYRRFEAYKRPLTNHSPAGSRIEYRAFVSAVAWRIVRGSDADWKLRVANGWAVPNNVVVPETVPTGRSVTFRDWSAFAARMRVGLDARSPSVAVSV